MSSQDAGAEPNMQQIAAELEMMEAQYENVAANEASATRTRMSVASAIESIRQITDAGRQTPSASGEAPGGVTPADGQSEAIIGLGGGVSVPVSIPAGSKMLMEIGSGVVLERDPAQILDYLENKIREIDIVIKNSSAQKASLAVHINQYRDYLNQFVRAMQGGQGQRGNV